MNCRSRPKLVCLFLIVLAGATAFVRAQIIPFYDAKERAEAGDTFAQAVVATHYQLGWKTDKNPELAAKYALASANAGEALGQFRLGALLREGVGVPKDEQRGMALQSASFNSLYAAKDPYSMTAAGIMIFQGKVVGQNISEKERRRDAAALYEKAADQGYAPAQFLYAMCAAAGHGIAKDPQLRDSYIQKAESQSYPLAIQWLREQSPAATASTTASHPVEAPSMLDQPAFAEEDRDEGNFESGAIETIVQEAPDRPRFVALGKGDRVLAVISDRVAHFYETATGRLLRKVSFRGKGDKVGKRIYAGSRPSQFYVVLADDFAEPSETEQCFTLNYLTGELQKVSLPKGSLVVGSNPKNNALAIYQSNGRNAMLSEFDADSGAVGKETVLPPAWREIVRAVYGVNGDCGIIGLTGGEGVSLDSLTVVSPGGVVRVVDPGAETARALARLLSFNPATVAPYQNDGDVRVFADVYGIKVGERIFDFVQSSLWSTSPGLMIRNNKDFAYLLASSPTSDRKLAGAGLAVDGIDCSADGGVIIAWKIAFKDSTRFRQDGRVNTEDDSRRARSETAETFVYDLSSTAYARIFTGSNQNWNAAISENGKEAAVATSQIECNSTPSSEFYGSGNRWPEVPSVAARVVLLDAWTGEIRTLGPLHDIYPFVYDETWNIYPELASGQTGLQFVQSRYVTDFSCWLVNSDEESIVLSPYARSLRPRFKGWDLERDARCRTITDTATGEKVTWSTDTAWGNFDGRWQRRAESILSFDARSGHRSALRENVAIGSAYAVDDGEAVVATTASVVKLRMHDGFKLAECKIPNEGLLGREEEPAVQTFALSADGTIAYALGGNHSVHRVSINGHSMELTATLYPIQNAPPAIVIEDGRYMVRGGSTKGVHFSDGSNAYPFEQFDLRLNRPDIVLERLGAPVDAVAIAKQLREKRLKRMGVTEEMLKPDFHVPELEIVGDVPATTDSDQIHLSIKASDSKYPLERLKVFVNNVPVNGRDGELLREESKTDAGLLGRITGAFTSAPKGPQSLERRIPIKLAAGRNKIQVSVLNNAGAESLYANVEVNCTAERPKPTLYAVAMGVSEYSNPDWNLKYAAKDARDVLARLKDRGGDQYGEVKELLLTDKDVTKENLAKVREFLKSATIDDTVLMFAAGHGLLDSKYDYYFGTTDIDFNNPSDKGIAFEEFDDILADLPCLKKSLLVDTCHAGELDQDEKALLASADSGGSAALPTGKGVAMRSIGTRGMNVKAIEGARGASEWYDRLQGLFVDLRRGSGSTILTSSAGAEYALESSEQQNGLFTYVVLEALDGKPDADTNKDGSVQVSELGEYVKKRVSDLTNNKQTPNTRRVNLESDFTLAKTK